MSTKLYCCNKTITVTPHGLNTLHSHDSIMFWFVTYKTFAGHVTFLWGSVRHRNPKSVNKYNLPWLTAIIFSGNTNRLATWPWHKTPFVSSVTIKTCSAWRNHTRSSFTSQTPSTSLVRFSCFGPTSYVVALSAAHTPHSAHTLLTLFTHCSHTLLYCYCCSAP